MKLFISLVIVAIVVGAQALTDQQKLTWRKWSEECQTQTGVSQESINKIRAGEFVDDPKLKEHSLCFAKKAGLVDESGELLVEKFKEKLKRVSANDEEVDKITKKCLVKKSTPEETAFDSYRCVLQNKPKFVPV